ncbi:XK-related protein 8-like isoform X2 [Chiloscyllium plagiosum]|uniref:XK-related protein 8-like isoform X2 n=1 Tax=Chiloscyllium plagiosum TaxID=36176 RepID=UPI001CB87509|nr:XK-related protein 8-like isoform X2 [Chiloscyllium plagiosum]
MGSGDELRFSLHDLIFICLGLATFLFDLGTDVWVVASFFEAGDYFWAGAVLLVVLFCSVVVQMFSWCWFAGDREQLKSLSNSGLLPPFKTTVGDGALRLLHGLQLGFLVRYITALEVGFRMHKERDTVGLQYIIYLINDISMLRLFESIFESAPQLTLMLYIMMLKNQMKLHQSGDFKKMF